MERLADVHDVTLVTYTPDPRSPPVGTKST